MTGAFLRVCRNGKWENIEIERLSEDELIVAMDGRNHTELVRWIGMLAHAIANIEDQESAEQP